MKTLFTVLGSGRSRQDADDKSWKRFGSFLHEILRLRVLGQI